MIEKFKKTLNENGQSIRWFYDRYDVHNKCGVTYGGFCHQLNGYSPLSSEGKTAIKEYLGANAERQLDTAGQVPPAKTSQA